MFCTFYTDTACILSLIYSAHVLLIISTMLGYFMSKAPILPLLFPWLAHVCVVLLLSVVIISAHIICNSSSACSDIVRFFQVFIVVIFLQLVNDLIVIQCVCV